MDNHSSGTLITERLEQHTRKLKTGRLIFPEKKHFPILSFSKRGLPCRGLSPTHAVVSYTAFSPLPVLHSEKLRRYVFCGTFHCLTTPGCYPALCPMEFGLSSSFCNNAKTSDCPAHLFLYLKIFVDCQVCKSVRFTVKFSWDVLYRDIFEVLHELLSFFVKCNDFRMTDLPDSINLVGY